LSKSAIYLRKYFCFKSHQKGIFTKHVIALISFAWITIRHRWYYFSLLYLVRTLFC